MILLGTRQLFFKGFNHASFFVPQEFLITAQQTQDLESSAGPNPSAM